MLGFAHKISSGSGRVVFVCSGRQVFVCSGREVFVSAAAFRFSLPLLLPARHRKHTQPRASCSAFKKTGKMRDEIK
ncbi:hypothetical protein [Methanimicrococcus hongohii]|uniref:hypothetical protein n=1 Tax=Methanimicrococcus hongohii TaxID=3028295 RepID=UPI0029302F73|nr:hypothetical protein [Methanimicrococcus sp. Hf6]